MTPQGRAEVQLLLHSVSIIIDMGKCMCLSVFPKCPMKFFQFVSVLQNTLHMVVCSFSWANEKIAQFYLFSPTPPQLCQILCFKKLLLRKIKRRISTSRSEWIDRHLEYWDLEYLRLGYSFRTYHVRFRSNQAWIVVFSSPACLGEEGTLSSSSSSPAVSCCKLFF